MAYENYSFVSWSTGTPITSARLDQMSTNIEEVKNATDGYPRGILKLKQASSNVSITSNIFTAFELISLKNEGGSPDNRVTVEPDRYYRITLAFPGVVVANAGGEDSTYFLSFNQGLFGGVVSEKANYKFSSGPGLYVSTANATANISILSATTVTLSNANITGGTLTGSNITNASISAANINSNSLSSNLKLNSGFRFGAGTYSIVVSSAAGLTNESFHIKMGKVQGASNNNASSFTIVASESPMQLYIEDIGGTV